ncbi:hypothetical protein E3N88_25973 [Mikania micrantha]|uniref:Uncharacterized protein n=1 Tax=Mikania micrantha TaxID=192012 RepID=A0A5N6N6E1_9ASTR|nr:hypothetical protein E3N88_25973 [Mikania micrantha]
MMIWIGNRAESRAKALIPLCRTKIDLGKQHEIKRNLLYSLWNSAKSYSRVFQSKPTATVVIRRGLTLEHTGKNEGSQKLGLK